MRLKLFYNKNATTIIGRHVTGLPGRKIAFKRRNLKTIKNTK